MYRAQPLGLLLSALYINRGLFGAIFLHRQVNQIASDAAALFGLNDNIFYKAPTFFSIGSVPESAVVFRIRLVVCPLARAFAFNGSLPV